MTAVQCQREAPQQRAYESYDPYAYPCPYCGEWPDDEDRSPGRSYCRKCDSKKRALHHRRARQAELSQFWRDWPSNDSKRAAMLASAIVTRLGGYDKAAAQLVDWIQQSIATGKAPREAMRACRCIADLIRLGSAADE